MEKTTQRVDRDQLFPIWIDYCDRPVADKCLNRQCGNQARRKKLKEVLAQPQLPPLLGDKYGFSNNPVIDYSGRLALLPDIALSVSFCG
jgi:hypothetical protein